MANKNESTPVCVNCTEDEHTMFLRGGEANRSVVIDNKPTYGLIYTLPLTVIGVFSVGIASMAMIALSRTKKTPKNVRILSTCLLFCDTFGTVCFAIRRHSNDVDMANTIQLFGICNVLLAYIVVTAMSVDRLAVLQYPNVYIRHVTFRRGKYFLIILIVSLVTVYTFVRCGLCAIYVKDLTFDHILVTCQEISFRFFRLSVGSGILISVCCYAKIIVIIRKQFTNKRYKCQHNPYPLLSMKMYKSTSLVGVFLSNVLFTGTCYVVILIVDIDLQARQLSVDLVNLINSVFDTIIYVLWFKECRMQMLRMLSACVPSLSITVDNMKIDIFHIVMSERKQSNE